MRLLTWTLLVALLAAVGHGQAAHVHVYAGHDHPEHHHGAAVHDHGDHHQHADHHADDDPAAPASTAPRLTACAADAHAVAVQALCGVHLLPGVLAPPARAVVIVTPARASAGYLIEPDRRVHGPPGRTLAPPRAPPTRQPA